MKTAYTTIVTLFISIFINAQTPYEKGMQKAFDLWNNNNISEASSLFQRIAKVEEDNWLPSFYAGYTLVLSSFEVEDETTLKLKLDKATALLNQASTLSPENAEILIAQALVNTSYITFDGQKYGMTMSRKNTAMYEKALQLAPQNPRVILAKAEWDMGTARFFGKSTKPFCNDIAKAVNLFENEKVVEKFYPKWGKEKAQQLLEECEK